MRSHIKLVLFGALCFFTYVLLMARFIIPNPYRRYWRAWVLKKASRAGLFILGIRLSIKGKFPQPPFLMVTNHLGYTDMFILASLSGCIFVAKQETASWPIIGHFIRSLGTIFINRQSVRDSVRVGQLITGEMAAGEGVVVFPEGTSSPGSEVLPFKAALLQPAAVKGLPVWGGSFKYKTPQGCLPAHLSVCWWGDMEFWPHWMSLLALPSIESELTIAPEPQKAIEVRELVKKLETQVKELFQPTVRGVLYEEPHVR